MTAKKSAKTETASETTAAGFEAMTKATEVATKAAETLGSEMAAYTKKSFEDMTAAAQDMANVKTPAELLEKQASFAKTAFEGFFAEVNKMTGIYTETAKEISEPFNKQFAAFKPFAA